jgi:pimeloyl-ACP methyl ester carboxylesterase
VEFAVLLVATPLLGFLPRGDGRDPVLVLPGFGGGDRSTAQLRRVLRSLGHDPHGWGLGPNLGPHPYVVAGVSRRIAELHERTGRRVNLVGWSLGGTYAREMARERPELVRQVITLASPFRYRTGDRTHASALYDAIGPIDNPFSGHNAPEHQRPDLPVPSTCIYTRTDGIVRWHLCIEAPGERRENIEVLGTHSGLGHNIAAVAAIADRLAQPDGQWSPFRPPPWFQHLYPPAASWAEPARRAS